MSIFTQSHFSLILSEVYQTRLHCVKLTPLKLVSTWDEFSAAKSIVFIFGLCNLDLCRYSKGLTRAPSRHVANWYPLPIINRLFWLWIFKAISWISWSSFNTSAIFSGEKNNRNGFQYFLFMEITTKYNKVWNYHEEQIWKDG